MGEGNNLYFDNKDIANQLAMYVTDMMTQKERLNFQSYASSSSKFKAFTTKLSELWEDEEKKEFIINKFLINSSLKRNGYMSEDSDKSKESLFELFPSDDITFEAYISSDIKKRIRSNITEKWSLDNEEESDETNELEELLIESDTSEEESIDDLVTDIIQDMDNEDNTTNVVHINVGDEDSSDNIINNNDDTGDDNSGVVDYASNDFINPSDTIPSMEGVENNDEGYDEEINGSDNVFERITSDRSGNGNVSDSFFNIPNGDSPVSDLLKYDKIVFDNEESIKFFCPSITTRYIIQGHLEYERCLEVQFVSGYNDNGVPIITRLRRESDSTDIIVEKLIKPDFYYQRILNPNTYSVNMDNPSDIQLAKELCEFVKMMNPNANPVAYIIDRARTSVTPRDEKENSFDIIVNKVVFAHDINQNEEYLFHNKINGELIQYITIEHSVYLKNKIDLFKKFFDLKSLPDDLKIVDASLRSLLTNEIITLKEIKERSANIMAEIERDVRGKLDKSIYLT